MVQKENLSFVSSENTSSNVLNSFKTPVIFSSSKIANTLGMFDDASDFSVVRIHSDDLLVEPSNYLKIPDEKLTGVSYENNSNLFYQNVVQSKELDDLVSNLLKTHGSVNFLSYQSHHFPSNVLDKYGDKIVNLGVDKKVAERFYDKLEQFDFLKSEGFKLPDFELVQANNAEKYLKQLDRGFGIYASRREGDGGSGVIVTKDSDEFKNFLDLYDGEDLLLVEGLNMDRTLSIDALIVNPEEVYPFGLSESIFSEEDSKACVGSYSPMGGNSMLETQLKDLTKQIGSLYAKEGVEGIVNFDFNITKDGRIEYGELNPRPGASTGNKIAMMDRYRSEETPSMFDLLMESKDKGTLKHYFKNREGLWSVPSDSVYLRKRLKIKEGIFNGDPDSLYSDSSLMSPLKEHAIYDVGSESRDGAWGVLALPPVGSDLSYRGELGKLTVVGKDLNRCKEISDYVEKEVVPSVVNS